MNPDTLPGPVVEAAARALMDGDPEYEKGTYGPDDYEAMARAALGAALPLLALDRDTITNALHSAGWYARGDLDPRDVDGIVHDVLAASPLRTVTDAQAEAWEEGHALTCVYYPDCASNGHHDNPHRAARLAGGEDQ